MLLMFEDTFLGRISHRPSLTGGSGTTTPSSQKFVNMRSIGDSMSANGAFSSAIAEDVISPACLSSGR
jgi:hypothetical protein